VPDRVDHALPYGDTHIVLSVLVQTQGLADVIAHQLDTIEHFERAGELEVNNH
jgi:hypothetical protein